MALCGLAGTVLAGLNERRRELAVPRATGQAPPAESAPAAGPAPSAAVPAPAGPVVDTEWFALAPSDWEPGKTFADDVAELGDDDPRAIAALDKLRAAWADAPVEPSMDGARIRIGGFIIPLDSDHGAVTELLLVPYFGACIHAPPPLANQVIHVFLRTPLRKLRMMDAVHVSGTLRLARERSPDNVAGLADIVGYELDAEDIVPYVPEE